MAKPNLREYNREKSIKCRAYYTEHPDASIADVAKAVGTSQRTAAQVRSNMVKEGLLSPGRNAEPIEPEPDNFLPPPPPVKRKKPINVPNSLVDDVAMAKLAAAGGKDADDLDFLSIDFDSLDDEVLRKRLLKGIIKIAFTPGIHPDTQLSATQVWVKLKDMARAKELGPGRPKTKADAIARLVDMLVAVGPQIAIEAMTIAFNVKESDDAPTTIPEANAPVVVAEGSPPPTEDDPIAPPYDS